MTEEKKVAENTEEKTTRKPATRKVVTKKVEQKPEVDATELAKQIAEEMFAKMKAETDKEIASLKEQLEKTKTSKRSSIDPNRLVTIRSTIHGELFYLDRQGLPYAWEEFGATQDLPFSEVQYLRGAKRAYFEKGYMFIEDEEVAKALRLDGLYQDIAGNIDLENLLLNKPIGDLEKFLDKAPKNLKNSLGHFALKLMKSKQLADYNKINLIQEKTGLELKLYLE